MENRLFKKSIFSLFTLSVLSISGAAPMHALEEVRQPENRVIYEVFVRNFSPQGNFKGVEAQIPRLKELGVDVIWLMPIYKLGDTGHWGTYSSPYAIKDYQAIEPSNGSAEDLHSLITTIHENGMEVWFDWVGNHTSIDNVWVSQHPEFYEKENGKIKNPNGVNADGSTWSWDDVYQLDVNNHQMHQAMIKAMKYWVDEFDIDGYRCDYASGPSQEFWEEATSQVTKNGKRIAWLAEDDAEPELVTNGWFDYNWTWQFFGSMEKVKNGGNINELRNAAANLHTDNRYTGKSRIMYTSSHDVLQDNGAGNDVGYRVFGNLQDPFTVLQFTVYGCPVIYNGQEIGLKEGKQLLSEKYPINWNATNENTVDFYKKLIWLKHAHPSLKTGLADASYKNLETNNQNRVMAYQRGEDNNTLVVLLNLSGEQVDNLSVKDLPEGNFIELFSDQSQNFDSKTTFSIPAYGYKVFYNQVSAHLETYYIYINDKTGWKNLYVYSWANNSDANFGTWPGVKATDKTEIDGIDYYRIPFEGSGKSVNLIFNNGEGKQYDGPDEIKLNQNYGYITFEDEAEQIDAPVEKSVPEIPDDDQNIDNPDNDDDDIDNPGKDDDNDPDFDNNDPEDGKTDAINNLYDEGETPEYFNLQGLKVKDPQKGLFIEKIGNKSKLRLF